MNATDRAMSLMREGVPLRLLIDLALGVSSDQLLYDDDEAFVYDTALAVAR